MVKNLLYVVVLVETMLFSCVAMGQTIPKDLAEWWRSNAPTCTAPDGFVFPSKKNGTEYDDGDINLFAGLLCAAGEPIGCETVRRGQDASGRWFRSPRRAQTDNLGEKNSFSPDMALGTMLYIATTGDVEALKRWLSWLDNARVCLIGSGDSCIRSPFLRYCTDDTEGGCTMRPVDIAMLSATAERFHVSPPTEDMQRLFHQARINLLDLIWAESQLNRPGYSQHLVAVEIFLLRRLGYDDERLHAAAYALSQKQPLNPFFLYLTEGATQRVVNLTLSLCPSQPSGLPTDMSQWAWEREDKDEAWRHSMLWDCVLMARLIGVAP